MPKHVHIITNQEFLRLVFGADWVRASVVTVPDLDGGSWMASAAGSGALADFSPAANNYFAVSLFDDPTLRRKENFQALVALVLDDVGKKVNPDTVLAALGAPSWRLETSPGSEHWGYRLTPRVTGLTRATRLIKRVIVGLCGGKDPGMDGVTRLMRLPVGTNTKAHLGFDGHASVMLDLNVEGLDPARVEMALPMAGDEVTPRPGGGLDADDLDPFSWTGVPDTTAPGPVQDPAGHISGARPPADPVLRGLLKLGRVKSNIRQMAGGMGWDVTCPWVEDHTPSGAVDTGTVYFRGGGFKCWHGHCDDKHPADVRKRVDELLRADSGGLLGLDDLDPATFDAVDPAGVPASPVAPTPGIVEQFWDETVYHATEDRFLTLRSDTANHNDKALDTLWRDRLREHLPPNAAATGPITPSQWYRRDARKRVIDGRTWWPGRVRLFIDTRHDTRTALLNTWRAPRRPLEVMPMNAPDPSRGDSIGDWYRLQELLFDAGTPEGAANLEHWLDYQAMIVGAYDVKPGHNPLFIGRQGAGKEIILRPIIDVLGPERYQQIDQNMLKSDFNDWVMHRLVVMPEVYRPARWNARGQDEYQRIKALCDPGKPFIPVNQKYRGIIQARNVFVLVMTSNEDKPLPLPPDDRRVWVVRVKETGWPESRFQALARGFEAPSPWGASNSEAIVEWLRRRWERGQPDILARMTSAAPMTRDKRSLIERSRGEVELWIEQLLARTPPDPLALTDIFTAREVMEKVENAGMLGGHGLARGTQVPGVNAVGRLLRKLGCEELNRGQTVAVLGGLHRLWAKPGDTAYGGMNEAELQRTLDAMRQA